MNISILGPNPKWWESEPWYQRVWGATKRRVNWFTGTRHNKLIVSMGGHDPVAVRFLLYRARLLALKHTDDPMARAVLQAIMRLDPQYAESTNIRGALRTAIVLASRGSAVRGVPENWT